jgi:hypothetical protein
MHRDKVNGGMSQPGQIVDRRFVLSAVVATQFIVLSDARAHEWYPLECCAGHDCAPADTVVRRDDGSYQVTARGLSVVIPPAYRFWRPHQTARFTFASNRSGRAE